MAYRRTPLGHKRREEATLGITPLNMDDDRIAHARQLQQRKLARRLQNAKGGAPPTRDQAGILAGKRENLVTTSPTGKRAYQGGMAENIAQRNPSNDERPSWFAWRPGGNYD
jgi:hypothetical protein